MLASSKFWAMMRKDVALEETVFGVLVQSGLLENTQLKRNQSLDKLNFLINFVLYLLIIYISLFIYFDVREYNFAH